MTRLRHLGALVWMTLATGLRTLRAFRNHRLGRFLPVVLFLLLWAIVLWLLNSIAPLAPFVYSLI